MLEIKELSTGYIIPIMKNYRYFKLENFFTAYNHRTKESDTYGLIEENEVIRIPKIDLEKLASLFEIEFSVTKIPTFPMGKLSITPVMKNQPKNDIQKEVISNVVKAFENKEERVIVSLPTGQGKTYVATNIISKLNTPTLILVKSVDLRDQWVKSFYTHSNIRNILPVKGSSDLVSLLENGMNYDVIITTHRSLQNFIETVGVKNFNRLLLIQKIGLKIYDEFDLETDSTFKIETHTNVANTLYLSATDYKSPNYNKVFQAVYGHLSNFGKEYGIKPDRNALFVLYNSRPTKSQWGRCHRYTIDGPMLDYHKYHEYCVTSGTYIPGMKVIWEKIIKNKYYNKEDYLKTVFFIGRKVTAEKFRKSISQIFGIPEKAISILNSDTPDKDREKAKNYKLIVSTSDSMGRGIDLKNLDVIVDLETRASLSKTTQVVGRVSRTGMKNVGIYINFIDYAFPTVIRNFERKIDSNFYDEMFTNIKTMDLRKDEKE